MNTPLWISGRLSLNRSGRTGVVIAVAGVALAVMVMEFTLAVVVGFKHEIQRKLMGFDAQITVEAAIAPADGLRQDFLTLTPDLDAIIARTAPGAEVSLALRQPGIVKTNDDFEGTLFIARDPASDFSFERGNIRRGVWPDFAQDSTRNDLVISETMADALGLDVGDRVYSTFIIGEDVRLRRQTIAGTYRSDFGDYDKTVCYASMPFLQSVAGIGTDAGTRVELRGLPVGDIEEISAELQSGLLTAAATGELDAYHPVRNIMQTGAMYFNWLALLDTNVIVIFILMLAVAGFTLVSSLFILILERVRTIGILRALGAGKPAVRRIFVYLTMKTVGIGLLIGNILGIGLLLIQRTWHIIPLNPEMYYLSSVPVEINWLYFLLLNLGVAVAAWLILVLPAHLASGIDPAGAVKYE